MTGTVFAPDGTVPDPTEYDPYGYPIQVWTEGFGCGAEWQLDSSRRLSNEDGSWVAIVHFPSIVGPALEDSVCTHVVLFPPPASPWRRDTISVGGLIMRQERPYDSAEAHFILKPKVDTAALR